MDDADECQANRRRLGFKTFVGVGILGITAVWWCLYVLSGFWWVADVAMSLSAYIGVGLFGIGVVALAIWRSCRFVVVLGLSGSVFAMCLSDRRVFAGGVESDQTYLRVVTMNLNMGNLHADELFMLLSGLDDDVVVLVEPRWEVFAAIMDGRDSLARFPYREWREREGLTTPPVVILSRWAIERDVEVSAWIAVSVVVDRDKSIGGRFRLVGMHPHSPRSQARWEMGNRVVDGLVDRVGGLGGVDGLPVVVAGDMNGGPLGYRDRVLKRGLGVRRSSAFFDYRGTYPSNVSMFGLLIDDIWIDSGFGVVSWDTVEIPGSDHYGVRVGLRNSGF